MICAIVLAAGRSVRMGTQKLLLPFRGKPLIAHVLDEVLNSPVKQVVVVVGRDGERLREALGGKTVSFVQNPDLEGDMLSSVRCGLRALPKSCEAALIVLGDQPGISRKLISQLTECHGQNLDRIIAPEFNGKRGHPLLIASRFFNEIIDSYDGLGLQGLLKSHPDAVQRIPVTTPATLEDMDTPEDYQRLIRLGL
jgi:molybdenum cofactor cytidylyltransferase